jgi:glycosyltransferase involved in cell wall biosynthesis
MDRSPQPARADTVGVKASTQDGDPRPLPLVTVMIPTYNQAAFLGAAVESALAQDYPRLEVVVSDDASSDATERVAAAYAADPRLRYHRNPSNIGRVANYRRLLNELAAGEWVINLDGDDCFLDPTYIREAVRRAMADPAVVMVFAKALKAADAGAGGEVLNGGVPVPAIMDGAEFLVRFPPFGTVAPLHLTCLYHRASALETGFYRKDILSSDFESLYRLMLSGRVAFVDRLAALWRQHGSNASATTSFEALRANLDVFEGPYRRAIELDRLTPAEADRWLRQRLARYLLSALLRAAKRGIPLGHALRLASHLLVRHPGLLYHLPAMALAAARDAFRPVARSA